MIRSIVFTKFIRIKLTSIIRVGRGGGGNLFLIVKQIKELSILVDIVRPGISRQYFFCFHAQNSACQKGEVQNIPQQH